MKIITLEEHYADQRIMDANSAFNKKRPPMKPDNVYEFLMDNTLSDEEKELIAHGNAERILHMQ